MIEVISKKTGAVVRRIDVSKPKKKRKPRTHIEFSGEHSPTGSGTPWRTDTKCWKNQHHAKRGFMRHLRRVEPNIKLYTNIIREV